MRTIVMADIRVRNDAVVSREIDDTTVLLALDTSQYLELNTAATELWPLMVEGTTQDAMVALLVREFQIDRDRAASDVDAFVATCRRHDLLVPDPVS